MKAKKLANSLGISVEEAETLMAKYMDKWVAVRRYFEETEKSLTEDGYVYTYLGRRRFLPDIKSPRDYQRFRAGRQGANSVIQGTAAEIAKCAMLRLFYDKRLQSIGWQMLSQIHDELVCEGPEETKDEAKAIVKEAMEHPFAPDLEFGAPLSGSPAVGPNWYACK